MINLFLYISLVIQIFISTDSPFQNDDGWKIIQSTDKYKIYTRKTDKSKIKEVRAEGILSCNIESIIEALNDVEKYTEWIYKCIKSYQFAIINKDEYHYYVYTDVPFPFADRDLVVHTNQWIDQNEYWHSESIAKPKMIQKTQGVVRIKTHRTKWKIKENSSNSIKFEYNISTDPSGLLPAWIINLAVTKGPIKTIQSLEKRSIYLMNQS